MKKLIYGFWILSFASTGSLVLTTAWKTENQNKQLIPMIADFTPTQPISWVNLDLRNFVVPNHHLNIQNQQAIDPSQSDLNINLDYGDVQQQLIDKILIGLDNKYANFNSQYLKENTYFEDNLNQSDYKHTFKIVNIDNQQSWDIAHALKIPLGCFSSYNLALENLQTKTSFNFSLNLTHFDLNPQSINFTSFGALPYIHQYFWIYTGNEPHYADTNTLTANMNKYVNVKNPEYAGQTDSFFLKPIKYSYHSSIWEDDDSSGYHPDTGINQKGKWNYSDFQQLGVDFSDAVEDPIDAESEGSGQYLDTNDGSTVSGQQWMSIAMYTDYWRINNTNTFMFKGVGATESTMDQYPNGAGDWEIIPFYGYNSLTTSYKTKLFNNSPYPLDEGSFDAGQIILNQLKNLNTLFLRTPITDRDIKNPTAQTTLKSYLKLANPNLLTALQWDNISFNLASGGTTMAYGDNSAYVSLDWYVETAQVPITIDYKPVGYESAQDIANKLQGKTIVLDPKFWVGKDIKNYKEQLDNAIVSQGILTKDEVQYVSWGDLTINQARSYPNCDFTVSKDGQTANAGDITINVKQDDQAIFNKANNIIQEGLMNDEKGSLKYNGPTVGTTEKNHIDTSDPKAMQDLISSVGEDPAIMHYDPNFNKEYSKYISFDKQIINENDTVTMHLKVGNYTKDYQVNIWWQSMS